MNDIEFNDLVFKALDHGVNSVSGGERLVPFVMTPTHLERFLSQEIEDAKFKAEDFFEKQEIPFAALVYEGVLTVEGVKNNAVFVKAVDKNNGKTLILAQRYVFSGTPGEFRVIGNPVQIS